MRILIVGAGALGGVIASRLVAAGSSFWLATRTGESAETLKREGLRVSGVGGSAAVPAPPVAAFGDFTSEAPFDLIVLATKAHDATAVAPNAMRLLATDGVLLPIQNGAVSELIAARLGSDRIIGGLSNLGATMIRSGVYEQRNAGHLLIGEFAGGRSDRLERVRAALSIGIDTRVTTNIRGAIWSKLMLNCSVTTIGAVAGMTMREYVEDPAGRRLFVLAYNESLAVAVAAGATPERMLVDPTPPATIDGTPSPKYDAWLASVVAAYGDAKPSMLQDFERGRQTEVDFINGYVTTVGRKLGVPTPVNDAVVESVHAITRGDASPSRALIADIVARYTRRAPDA